MAFGVRHTWSTLWHFSTHALLGPAGAVVVAVAEGAAVLEVVAVVVGLAVAVVVGVGVTVVGVGVVGAAVVSVAVAVGAGTSGSTGVGLPPLGSSALADGLGSELFLHANSASSTAARVTVVARCRGPKGAMRDLCSGSAADATAMQG